MRFLCVILLIAANACACVVSAERSLDAVEVDLPFGVEIGPDGALYVTEIQSHRVHRFDLAGRTLTPVAGNGQRGYSGDGGPALHSEMNEPYEVRFDSRGNMYVVEMKNHVVRRVDAKTQAISTVVGIGKAGFGGDGGPAIQAQLNQPHSIALDRDDNLFIADIGNHRIRRVDAETGVIDSIAGNGERTLPKDGRPARDKPILGPRALFVHDDTLWIALREGQSVWRMKLQDGILHHVAGTGKPGHSGDGGPAIGARFKGPKGIAVAPDGAVFVVDSENNAVRHINPKSGVIETLRTEPLNQPHGICVAPNGDVFIGDSLNNRVRLWSTKQ
jgi:DNA-binding beta-propeller fold protein YncE